VPAVPVGYLIAVGFVAWCAIVAVAAPMPRRSSPSNLKYWFGIGINELPFVAFWWIVAVTALAAVQGDVGSRGGWIGLGVATVAAGLLGVIAWRGLRAGPAVDRALREGLGADWRSTIDPELAPMPRRRPWIRILLGPWLVRRRDVVRLANLRYGDAGKHHLLDLYRHRKAPSGGPLLVHLHGGAFRSGRKNREARPLLYRLASQGWVCVSANYRLSPDASFPDHLIDVKSVIAWARAHGPEYGADPTTIFVAGSSAGGHLATMAALTAGDATLQPGFEDADTSVTAVISLYGYYGGLDGEPRSQSSPATHVHAAAPPFLAVHGSRDTIVLAKDARRFVDELRATADGPVVYAELPGGQHSFDLFHSPRFEAVIDGVEAFTAWVRTHQRDRRR
jgi:acetyl esterase/lipase